MNVALVIYLVKIAQFDAMLCKIPTVQSAYYLVGTNIYLLSIGDKDRGH